MPDRNGEGPDHRDLSRVVDAVLWLVELEGVQAVTVGALAERTGLEEAMLRRHYPDRETLWLAVLDVLQGRLGNLLEHSAGRAPQSPLQALEHIFTVHISFIGNRPAVPRLMIHLMTAVEMVAVRDRIAEIVRQYEANLILLFKQAQSRGQIRESVSARTFVTLLVGFIQGIAVRMHLFGPQSVTLGELKRAFRALMTGVVRSSAVGALSAWR